MNTVKTLHDISYFFHVKAIGAWVPAIDSNKVKVIVFIHADGAARVASIDHRSFAEILHICGNYLLIFDEDRACSDSL